MGRTTLPPLTSLECALALQRFGYELETVNESRLSLRHETGRRVFLPRHALLNPIQIRAILEIARVREDQFANALPPGISGTFVRPDLDALSDPTASAKRRG